MCRANCDGGRRCSSSRGPTRRAADRARYAAGVASGAADPAGEPPGGGGDHLAEEYDWDLISQTIAEKRVAAGEALDRYQYAISGQASREWMDYEEKLEADGMSAKEAHEVGRSKYRELTIPGLHYQEAEKLTTEIGTLIDTEIVRRVGEPPTVGTEEEIAEVRAEQTEFDTAIRDARRERVRLTDERIDSGATPELDAAIKMWDDRVDELADESAAAREHLANLIYADHGGVYAKAQAQAAREILSEFRDFGDQVGHRFHPGAQKPAMKSVQDHLGEFPSDWVRMSHDNDSMLAPKTSRGRAHYSHNDYVKTAVRKKGAPVGYTYGVRSVDELHARARELEAERVIHQWSSRGRLVKKKILGEIVVDEENLELRFDYDPGVQTESTTHGSASVLTTNKVKSVTVHELTHRMEYVNPRLRVLESAFYDRRTKDGETRQYKYGRSDEFVVEGGFADEYIGKDYDGRAYEVMSVGMESVFAGTTGCLLGIGRDRADPDHRAFVLGALLAA